MNPITIPNITIPNITIPVIGLPAIGIPSVGFPSASGGGLVWPKGLKESIKAIYDPALQGMTNYDVIESYAEDFTNWIFRNNVADATIANNKLIITETKAQNDRFIYSTNANEDLILYITGIDTVGVCYYNGSSTLALHNGLNKIHTNKGYIDIRSCRGIGACNITITQLPTSILKDLSGNGNHAYLYGGKGKLNSGIGVYAVDFTTYNGGYEKEPSVAKLTKEKRQITKPYGNIDGDIEPYIVKIEGINTGYINYNYRRENGKEYAYSIQKDGVYTLPKCYKEGTTGSNNSFVLYEETDDAIITITQIPDYPDQLCYDGKMYAVCYGSLYWKITR